MPQTLSTHYRQVAMNRVNQDKRQSLQSLLLPVSSSIWRYDGKLELPSH